MVETNEITDFHAGTRSAFYCCAVSVGVFSLIGYIVALARHITTDVFYNNIIGSTSSIAFAAPLVSVALSRPVITPLVACVLLCSTQLIFYSYRIHEVKNYWTWTLEERTEHNDQNTHDVSIIMTQDTMSMLWLATTNMGLSLERVLTIVWRDTFAAYMVAVLLTCSLCIVEQWAVTDYGSSAVAALLGTSIGSALVATVYYVLRLQHLAISTLAAECIISVGFAALLWLYKHTIDTPLSNYSAKPRATDVLSGTFHIFAAFLVCVNVNIHRPSYVDGMSKLKPLALFALINIVQLMVFTDLANDNRSFLVVYDLTQLVLYGLFTRHAYLQI